MTSASPNPPYLYDTSGDLWSPTALTGGPWRADSQHGAPVNALLAHLCQRRADELDMAIARITIDLIRAVPRQPLIATATDVRVGRRLAAVDVTLRDDAGPAAVCRAALMQPGVSAAASQQRSDRGSAVPQSTSDDLRNASTETAFIDAATAGTLPTGFHNTVTVADAPDGVWFDTSVKWLTPTVPLAGVVKLIALADFTTVIARRVRDPDAAAAMSAMNVDTTVVLTRRTTTDGPISLTTPMLDLGPGYGVAAVSLGDDQGAAASAIQSVIVL